MIRGHGIKLTMPVILPLIVSFVMMDCSDNDRYRDDRGTGEIPLLSFSVDERIPERFPGITGVLTFDSRRNVVIFVSQFPVQTWEWTDNEWRRHESSNRPPSSRWMACRFFPEIGKTVLLCSPFEESSRESQMEMWLFDGIDWQQSFATDIPSRPGGELLYDPVNHRLLYTSQWLFYMDIRVYTYDFGVYEFDGFLWTRISEGTDDHAFLEKRSICIDESRGRIVLIGWYCHYFSEDSSCGTWEFDGQHWLRVSNAWPEVSMVYDRFNQRLLSVTNAIRSVDGCSSYRWTDVSQYHEGNWTKISETCGITVDGPLTWHDGLNAIFSYQYSKTMLFIESDIWMDVSDASAPGNSASADAEFFPSREGTVIIQQNRVYDDQLETWLWDGHANTLLNSHSRISGQLSLIADPTTDRLIMFDHSGWYFWRWSSDHWEEFQIGGLPPDSSSTLAPCHFPPRNSIVVLGWKSAGGRRHDAQTWEIQNDEWRELDVPTSPSYRTDPAIAYHEERRTIVLFGGEYTTCLNDTWEFDGIQWREIDTAHAPTFRTNAAMVYDQELKRIVLIGGQCKGDTYRDIWTFDGIDWTKADVEGTLTKRFSAASAYDPIRKKTILWGGQLGNTTLGSLIELTPDR